MPLSLCFLVPKVTKELPAGFPCLGIRDIGAGSFCAADPLALWEAWQLPWSPPTRCHQQTLLSPQVVTTENVSRRCHMSPGGAPWLVESR